MDIAFRNAEPKDAETIGSMVMQLTKEITERTSSQLFNIDLGETVRRCRELLEANHYAAIIGYAGQRPVAVSTLTETYALYAGGKIGVVQEFYVEPGFRSSGVGAKLIEQVRRYGLEHKWSCIELTTPPLPEFSRTLGFYEANGLAPVGGRKMRQYLQPTG